MFVLFCLYTLKRYFLQRFVSVCPLAFFALGCIIMSSLCKDYFVGYLPKDLTKRSAVSYSFFIINVAICHYTGIYIRMYLTGAQSHFWLWQACVSHFIQFGAWSLWRAKTRFMGYILGGLTRG